MKLHIYQYRTLARAERKLAETRINWPDRVWHIMPSPFDPFKHAIATTSTPTGKPTYLQGGKT
jgi:hypothetical protein